MPIRFERTTEQWTSFALKIGLAVVVFVICVFTWIHLQTGTLVEKQLLDRAKAHFQTIVATRNWSAMHGGVYVVKQPGMQSNPYLNDPDITDNKGRTLTLKNPSLITREVSELAQREGLLIYHMTSLIPINPANGPNAFERRALTLFEVQGGTEEHTREIIDTRTNYRYIGALFVQESCLQCHAKQGYKVGDVRGGISVTFDIEEMENTLRKDRALLLFIASAASLGLLGIFFALIRSLMRRVESNTEIIRRLSITDELTGLANRRQALETLNRESQRAGRYGKPACVVMLDIDHFKRVNDTWGHQTGDMVLRGIAAILRDHTRGTDLAARFGGEEFLLLLPEAALNTAAMVAEKIRAKIETHDFVAQSGEHFRVTVSQGVACIVPSEYSTNEEEAIRRADQALYTAKETGRNRVVENNTTK